MNQSMIVAPYLKEVAEELDTAGVYLGKAWEEPTEDAIARLTGAAECITRAIAQISAATERLAELVVDD